MNRVVGPRDCALAIALPLTEQQFLSHLNAEQEHDYASYIRSLHIAEGADDDYYWNVIYGPFAAVMSETLDGIAKCGITVVRDATLDDFRRLTAEFPVVTFVSHWRFRALRAGGDRRPGGRAAGAGRPSRPPRRRLPRRPAADRRRRSPRRHHE